MQRSTWGRTLETLDRFQNQSPEKKSKKLSLPFGRFACFKKKKFHPDLMRKPSQFIGDERAHELNFKKERKKKTTETTMTTIQWTKSDDDDEGSTGAMPPKRSILIQRQHLLTSDVTQYQIYNERNFSLPRPLCVLWALQISTWIACPATFDTCWGHSS